LPIAVLPLASLFKRAAVPTAVLPKPVVLFKRAVTPTAVFKVPVVLNKSAAAPMAVFRSAILKRSVPAPTAVLKLVSTALLSENQPTAVFATPITGVEAQESVLTFCCVEAGIATIRRRNNRSRFGFGSETEKRECHEK
jgi:hypothetical protein